MSADYLLSDNYKIVSYKDGTGVTVYEVVYHHCVMNSRNSIQYEDLRSAVAAAQAGDTLYLQGNTVIHESIVVDKELTLVSNGYHII